jgi:hypothetical protein
MTSAFSATSRLKRFQHNSFDLALDNSGLMAAERVEAAEAAVEAASRELAGKSSVYWLPFVEGLSFCGLRSFGRN